MPGSCHSCAVSSVSGSALSIPRSADSNDDELVDDVDSLDSDVITVVPSTKSHFHEDQHMKEEALGFLFHVFQFDMYSQFDNCGENKVTYKSVVSSLIYLVVYLQNMYMFSYSRLFGSILQTLSSAIRDAHFIDSKFVL